MSKKLLFSIIVILLITNLATFIVWANDGNFLTDETKIIVNGEKKKIKIKDNVAVIGNEKVTYDEWVATLQDNYGKRQLKQLIDDKVVNQLAHKNNIVVEDKIIEREIAYLTTLSGVMDEKEISKKESDWKRQITYRYQLQALLTMNHKITEEESRTYYKKYAKQYDFKSSVQLSHIVVHNIETAEKIIKELEEGASFALLAREYSIDESSKDIGGYLGFFTDESQFLPRSYFEKALKMEEHTYSDPFQTDQGIIILYLHRFLPDITFTYEEVAPYIQSELALEQSGQELDAASLWESFQISWIYGK
ncbi:peptidylprolyl isomerase [Virgibacillus soli]|uniref:peptidylprolyl isomerase n=1 Tax=Paracerasibacillus soli TaxID=480284 RepID=UPI0035EF8BF7